MINAIFIILIAILGTDLKRYFMMQWDFLRGYSDARAWPSSGFIFKMFPALIVSTSVFALRFAKIKFLKFEMALSLFCLLSIVSVFISGKYFDHYLYGANLSAFLILLSVVCRSGVRASITAIGVLIFASFLTISSISSLSKNKKYDNEEFMVNYRRISDRVGQDPVMSLRASVVPVYYSSAKPFQPLIWIDHAAIFFGQGEDGYYHAKLEERPKFVLTSHLWCEQEGRNWKSCDLIAQRYEKVLDFAGEGRVPSRNKLIVGYDLYELKSVPSS